MGKLFAVSSLGAEGVGVAGKNKINTKNSSVRLLIQKIPNIDITISFTNEEDSSSGRTPRATRQLTVMWIGLEQGS